MTTELQAQSNRRNAQASTGPVTADGQARSARNALRHGYYATDIVMPGEDAHQFERLLASVQADWAPESDPERELTDEIAVALWRRRRLRRAEAELWAEHCDPLDGAPRTVGEAFAHDSESAGNAIEKLRRWWQGNERHLNRCQDKLALIQRLAGQLRQARPPEEVPERRRHAAREIDPRIGAPIPGEGELPPRLADRQAGIARNENADSAERTQSDNPQEDEAIAATVDAPRTPVTEDSPPARHTISRRERRALERQKAKARKRQGRAAA